MAPVHKTTWFQQQFPLSLGEMYMDILCTKQSQKSTPGTVALPRSKKRARAHDDVVILKGKRLRKGPGYYTHLADSAPLPVEQEMAGDCSQTETYRAPRRLLKVRRKTTRRACSGARQGTAGAKRGRKPKVDTPMEDALLVEHFCGSASPGGLTSSASSAERSAKQESQLLQQPANAAELHGATPTQPPARQTIPATCLAALLYVAFDSPQVGAPVAEKVTTSPELTAKESAAKVAAVKRVTTKKPAVTEPTRRSARLSASARVTHCEMQE